MPAPVFIGDEVTAAAYRLAGARIVDPEPHNVDQALVTALSESDYVLLTAEVAASVSPPALEAALAGEEAMVLIVPDVIGGSRPPDLGKEAERALGIEQ